MVRLDRPAGPTPLRVPAPSRALADDAGILSKYLDSTGSHRSARPEALLAVLNGLGIPIAQVGSATRLS